MKLVLAATLAVASIASPIAAHADPCQYSGYDPAQYAYGYNAGYVAPAYAAHPVYARPVYGAGYRVDEGWRRPVWSRRDAWREYGRGYGWHAGWHGGWRR
jgi:hypothetical protein